MARIHYLTCHAMTMTEVFVFWRRGTARRPAHHRYRRRVYAAHGVSSYRQARTLQPFQRLSTDVIVIEQITRGGPEYPCMTRSDARCAWSIVYNFDTSLRSGSQSFSTTSALAAPPPLQMAATPFSPDLSACRRVTRMREPDEPMGCGASACRARNQGLIFRLPWRPHCCSFIHSPAPSSLIRPGDPLAPPRS